MNLDMSGTIVAKSDQINASDITQPTIITITDVKVKKGDDQPVWITVAEYPKSYFKPGLTVRRILAHLWGNDGAAYIGRQIEIYNDSTVKWGGQEVGGIRVSRMSHIDKPEVLTLPEGRGKWKDFYVEPLPQQPQQQPQQSPQAAPDWDEAISDCQGNTDDLRALWTQAQETGAPQEVLNKIQAVAQQGDQQ
ncbi:hypothetical protein QDX21_04970 [Auritidibacter ignavus]|uniref:Uncharacterized protein n=1 Tax=Auritidibacter ignavus TaxID=678932 RepID=A0AAJ6AIL6_9MICC|nr:hypothetical protein [Auritidibacter ignavus]WGH94146.1 hypothetical protein QDX21_04970 [Auritidibacter ignavus]